MTTEITFTKVKLPFGWLGNMSPHTIAFEGKLWRTAEALFQAMRFDKTTDREIITAIHASMSPMSAKMIAKRYVDKMIITPRSAEDVLNMMTILRLKAVQHADLKFQLIKTGDAQLIEDVSARPNESGLFWGARRLADGTWSGQNKLGRTWMALRRDLRDELNVEG